MKNLPSPLFAKEGEYSSLYKREELLLFYECCNDEGYEVWIRQMAKRDLRRAGRGHKEENVRTNAWGLK